MLWRILCALLYASQRTLHGGILPQHLRLPLCLEAVPSCPPAVMQTDLQRDSGRLYSLNSGRVVCKTHKDKPARDPARVQGGLMEDPSFAEHRGFI